MYTKLCLAATILVTLLNSCRVYCMDTTQNNLNNALIEAVRHGTIQKIQPLIKDGASTKAYSRSGKTPLMLAVTHGHAPCVELLLKLGAKPETRSTTSKHTALDYAAVWGRVECLRILLQYKANINGTSDSGKTALHYAAEKDQMECANELVQCGADPRIKSKKNKTAFEYAISKEMQSFLEQAIEIYVSSTDLESSTEFETTDGETTDLNDPD